MNDQEAKCLGATHRHFKGGYYRVLHHAVDTTNDNQRADQRALVIYVAVLEGDAYGHYRGTIWAREAGEFYEALREGDGPYFYRFAPLKSIPPES